MKYFPFQRHCTADRGVRTGLLGSPRRGEESGPCSGQRLQATAASTQSRHGLHTGAVAETSVQRMDKRHESVTRGDRRARTPGPAPHLDAAAATPRSRRESFKQLFMRLFPRSGRNEHSPAL